MYLHMVMVSDRTGNSKWTAEAKLQNRATGSCGQKDEIQTGTHAATILPLSSLPLTFRQHTFIETALQNELQGYLRYKISHVSCNGWY
jgi:hypothetical protein